MAASIRVIQAAVSSLIREELLLHQGSWGRDRSVRGYISYTEHEE